MPVYGSDVASHYRKQERTLSGLIGAHRALVGKLEQAGAAVGEELAAAKHDLAATYLPELSDAALARAAKLTGFQGFTRRDPRTAMAQERKVLQATLTKIDADARYQHRDTLVGEGGTLLQELDDARGTLNTLQAECDRFESQLGFQELLEVGYDTPAFAEKWYHASYWRYWAAGDRICKALGLDDFGDDVLPAYKKYAEPRNTMRSDVQNLERKVDAVHELVREHDRVTDRLANLESIYLSQAQDFLGDHLEHADLGLLEQWIAGEAELVRPVQLGLRRLSGVLAKKSFVAEMIQRGVPGMIQQLETRRAKAGQKAAKFSRPKKQYMTYADRMVNDGFDAKATALQGQVAKLERRVAALVAARNYGGFDLSNDPHLWWSYLVGSGPPRFAPSLYDYYQRTPGAAPAIAPDYDASTGQAAGAAIAAGDLEQDAYLS